MPLPVMDSTKKDSILVVVRIRQIFYLWKVPTCWHAVVLSLEYLSHIIIIVEPLVQRLTKIRTTSEQRITKNVPSGLS